MRSLIAILLLTLITTAAGAAAVDDVRNLIDEGKYSQAFQAAEALLKKSPRDAATNYWYGRAALALGREKEAVAALATAAERGSLDAYPLVVEMAADNYDIDRARDLIDNWREALRKAKRSEPESLAELETRTVRLANQLDRIEDIPVIARYNISRREFETLFDKVNSGSTERGYTFLSGNMPFFLNNMGREIFWVQPDNDGINRLFTAGILDDGTREEPRELTEFVGDGDIAAPFMLEDGETLYFAARRDDDGIGGFDIYMTRRDGEGGFYEPSNIGMPYNSPADDLLFVIDENNNIGWWVTDRFDNPDSLAVMVFVPGKTRVNISPDDSNLRSRALLDNISATIPSGFDIAKAKARIPRPETSDTSSRNIPTFTLSLGNGRILTSTSQFRSREAASLMSDVLRTQRTLDDTIRRLDTMRRSFADGDTALESDIRSLEDEVSRKQSELKNLRNRVIRLETGAR